MRSCWKATGVAALKAAGAPEGTGLTGRIARNTLFVDSSRPSQVLSPVISGRA